MNPERLVKSWHEMMEQPKKQIFVELWKRNHAYTQPLHHGQNKAQGKFLSGLNLVWIHIFFPRQVA